jgi:hypothetical protein
MPDLVHHFRRADVVAGGAGQQHKAAILFDCPGGEVHRPVLFFAQPLVERPRIVRRRKLERL